VENTTTMGCNARKTTRQTYKGLTGLEHKFDKHQYNYINTAISQVSCAKLSSLEKQKYRMSIQNFVPKL
jgi:hypothetical protein